MKGLCCGIPHTLSSDLQVASNIAQPLPPCDDVTMGRGSGVEEGWIELQVRRDERTFDVFQADSLRKMLKRISIEKHRRRRHWRRDYATVKSQVLSLYPEDNMDPSPADYQNNQVVNSPVLTTHDTVMSAVSVPCRDATSSPSAVCHSSATPAVVAVVTSSTLNTNQGKAEANLLTSHVGTNTSLFGKTLEQSTTPRHTSRDRALALRQDESRNKFVTSRRGSADVLDRAEMTTMFVEDTSEGSGLLGGGEGKKIFRLRFDVRYFDRNTCRVTSDSEKITVRVIKRVTQPNEPMTSLNGIRMDLAKAAEASQPRDAPNNQDSRLYVQNVNNSVKKCDNSSENSEILDNRNESACLSLESTDNLLNYNDNNNSLMENINRIENDILERNPTNENVINNNIAVSEVKNRKTVPSNNRCRKNLNNSSIAQTPSNNALTENNISMDKDQILNNEDQHLAKSEIITNLALNQADSPSAYDANTCNETSCTFDFDQSDRQNSSLIANGILTNSKLPSTEKNCLRLLPCGPPASLPGDVRYSRSIQLPLEVDEQNLISSLSTDGILTVEAPLVSETIIHLRQTAQMELERLALERSVLPLNSLGSAVLGTLTGSLQQTAPTAPVKEKIGVPIFRDEDGTRRLHLIIDLGVGLFEAHDISVEFVKVDKIMVKAKRKDKDDIRRSKSKFRKEYELSEKIDKYSLSGRLEENGQLIVAANVKISKRLRKQKASTESHTGNNENNGNNGNVVKDSTGGVEAADERTALH